MKKYFALFAVLLIAFTVNFSAARAEDNGGLETRGRICTMDAKQCSDGSYVGRTGPDCEFAKCPDSDDAGKPRLVPSPSFRNNDETIREAARKKMEDLRAKIKEEKDTLKAKLKEDRINIRETALARFDAAVGRINNLKDRVNAQITKLEAKGVDVTLAKGFVVTAETKLAEARVKIAAANSLLAASIDPLSAENRAALITLAKDIQGLVKDAHIALINSIKSLKDAFRIKMGVDVNAKTSENESPRPDNRD